MSNLNKGDNKMQNEISKDIDKLILKYGFNMIKDYMISATTPCERLVANSEVKAPKVKYHPMPVYVGNLPINNPLNVIDTEYGEFIGSDVTIVLDNGQEITIPYKERYNENSTFKEYIERSVQHAYKVLNKTH